MRAVAAATRCRAATRPTRPTAGSWRLAADALARRSSASVAPQTPHASGDGDVTELPLSGRAPALPRRPTIHDPSTIVRPGEFADIATVIRNWWAFPAVGFNSILEIPVHRLEVFAPDDPPPVGQITVPNSIFGMPIRKDMVHKVYWFHRKALAGYCHIMQMYKWEWPGSNKKVRSQKKSGKGRMGRRKAPGRWEGSFTHALRPRDWRVKMPKRVIWQALRVMLSAKYVQGSIKVVDSFNLQSHKTKHLVHDLRRIVGRKCRSALLVHEGNLDVNDNFRWASAHIACVRRENVEGVSVYNLLKYHQVIITELALAKLITEIQNYPIKRGWGNKFATPDGKPAPPPEKVEGWNKLWVEKKERLHNAEFRAREYYREQQKWKWSSELKGALKVPRHDAMAGFRVKDFLLTPEKPLWEKLESLYADEDPVDEEVDEEEFDGLVDTLEESLERGKSRRVELIESADEVASTSLAALAAAGGRRSATRANSGWRGGEERGKGGA